MPNVFENFARVRVINLRSRGDRRKEMIEELRRVGLIAEFHMTVPPTDSAPWRLNGERGLFEANLACLRDALEARESLLLLEDDCDFTDAAHAVNVDRDVFWGGFDPIVLDDGRSSVKGTHCMGFNVAALQVLVPYLSRFQEAKSPPPIDGAYVELSWREPQMFQFAQVAKQRASRSDITPRRFFDRVPGVRTLGDHARSIRRRLLS